MNASDALIKTLVANGLEVVFANPGTSEMHLVAAIDNNPEIRPVLGLFEGVVSGLAPKRTTTPFWIQSSCTPL